MSTSSKCLPGVFRGNTLFLYGEHRHIPSCFMLKLSLKSAALADDITRTQAACDGRRSLMTLACASAPLDKQFEFFSKSASSEINSCKASEFSHVFHTCSSAHACSWTWRGMSPNAKMCAKLSHQCSQCRTLVPELRTNCIVFCDRVRLYVHCWRSPTTDQQTNSAINRKT